MGFNSAYKALREAEESYYTPPPPPLLTVTY